MSLRPALLNTSDRRPTPAKKTPPVRVSSTHHVSQESPSMSDSTSNLQSPVLRTIAVLTDAHPGMAAPMADLAAYYDRAAHVLSDVVSEYPHHPDAPLGRNLVAIYRNAAGLTGPKGGTR